MVWYLVKDSDILPYHYAVMSVLLLFPPL